MIDDGKEGECILPPWREIFFFNPTSVLSQLCCSVTVCKNICKFWQLQFLLWLMEYHSLFDTIMSNMHTTITSNMLQRFLNLVRTLFSTIMLYSIKIYIHIVSLKMRNIFNVELSKWITVNFHNNVRYFAIKSINFQKLYFESMNYMKRIIGQLLELTDFPFPSYGVALIGDYSI